MTRTRAYEIIAWVNEPDIGMFTPPKDRAECVEAARVFVQSGEAARAPGRMGRAAFQILMASREEA